MLQIDRRRCFKIRDRIILYAPNSIINVSDFDISTNVMLSCLIRTWAIKPWCYDLLFPNIYMIISNYSHTPVAYTLIIVTFISIYLPLAYAILYIIAHSYCSYHTDISQNLWFIISSSFSHFFLVKPFFYILRKIFWNRYNFVSKPFIKLLRKVRRSISWQQFCQL